MARNGTAANAAHAMVVRTASNGVAFQYRTAAGGASGNVNLPSVTGTVYVRLKRTGNSFSAEYSTTGTAWTAIGSPVTITMPTGVKAGLAVTSHVQGTAATATFTDVAVTTPTTTSQTTIAFAGPLAADGTYGESGYKFTNRGFAPYSGTANLVLDSGGLRTQDWTQRIELRRTDNAGFALNSFKVRRMFGTSVAFDIVGTKRGTTQTVTRSIDVTSDALTTVTMDATWNDLESVTFTPRDIGSGAAYALFDDVVLTA
jgi:hypothetical protein